MSVNTKEPLDKPRTDQEYADLGKALIRALVNDNIKVTDKWIRFIGISFVRGLFTGLGTIIGATILVGLLIYLLNAFDGLPLVGDWFERVQGSLEGGPDQL